MLQQRFGRALLRALAAIEPTLRRAIPKEDGEKDGAAPGSASKKRERDMSAEPDEPKDGEAAVAGTAGGDAGPADGTEAERDGFKRQKTEGVTGGWAQEAGVACEDVDSERLWLAAACPISKPHTLGQAGFASARLLPVWTAAPTCPHTLAPPLQKTASQRRRACLPARWRTC